MKDSSCLRWQYKKTDPLTILLGLARTLAYPSQKTEGSQEKKVRAMALTEEAARRPAAQNDSDYPLTLAQLALDLDQMDDFRSATEQLG